MNAINKPYRRTRGVGKIKYWTACVSMRRENGQRNIILVTGGCYTNLREAIAAMPRLNSSRAAVVRAGSNGMPVAEIVRHI